MLKISFRYLICLLFIFFYKLDSIQSQSTGNSIETEIPIHSLFFQSLKEGNLKIAKRISKSNDNRVSSLLTPLHQKFFVNWASRKGDLKLLKLLINTLGINPNSIYTSKGKVYTPLHNALLLW